MQIACIHAHGSFTSTFVQGIPEDMLVAAYKLIQLKMHYIFAPEAYNHANQAVQSTWIAPQ